MSQLELGIDVVAVTAPFQSSRLPVDVINGVTYFRTSVGDKDSITDKRKPMARRVLRLFKIAKFYYQLKKIIKLEQPDLLHAHAMFFCGLPAIWLGKKFNLPVVYEVRSLWMLNKTSKNNKKSLIEIVLFKIELYVMKRANKVIAINENLKQELLLNGISPRKIEVVKNAVNTTLIKGFLNNARKHQKKQKQFVFGYIGTLTPHEGLDFLIDAFQEFSKTHPNTLLRIFGGGVEKEKIEKLAKVEKYVDYMGSVEPEKIPQAFDGIDIIINPRYKNKLTDSVTPLKPLEAMAYNKLFIGSDVGGIKELVDDGENGLLFEAGNKEALIGKMKLAFNMKGKEMSEIKSRANLYVNKHKSWMGNAQIYNDIYSNMIVNQ